MAGTLTVDTIQSDSSNASTLNEASKVNFTSGMQIGGQDATFGGMRNRIINGDMVFDQRNAGASVTPTNGAYVLDRWSPQFSQTSKISVQQVTDAPTGFSYSSKITSLSSYSVVSGDYFIYRQHIEGYNSADFGFGTASPSTITVSFWVKSSLTGNFSVSVYNNDGTRSYPVLYTISSANTWEFKTVVVPGINSGTWLTTNGIGVSVGFGLGGGSTFSSTSGVWDTSGSWKPHATGAVSVVGTNAATWQVTGVQLEKGSAATAFEYRQYGQELALCQRYFISYGGTNGYERFAVGVCSGTTTASVSTFLPVPMRIAPSLSYSALSHFGVYDGGNVTVLTGFALDQPSTTIVSYTATVASGLTQYRPAIVVANNTSTARLQLSSEL